MLKFLRTATTDVVLESRMLYPRSMYRFYVFAVLWVLCNYRYLRAEYRA